MGNNINAPKTTTIDAGTFYITADPKPAAPKPAASDKTTVIDAGTFYITADAKPAAPKGDGFDRGGQPGADFKSFSSGARYTPAPAIGDVTHDGKRNIHRGQSGPSVKLAQELLTSNGYGPLDADGKFGAKTDAAVRAYQRDHGLTEDGKVGIATMRSLNAGSSASVEKEAGFKELSPELQAEVKSRYEAATKDVPQRVALSLLVEELYQLPADLQKKALDAAGAPHANPRLQSAVRDYLFDGPDAAALSRKLDAIIAG